MNDLTKYPPQGQPDTLISVAC